MPSLERFVRPWRGVGIRHIPAGSPFGPLDFRFAGLAETNRWNVRGEPTLYLASDRGVALAEFTRHLQDDRAPGLAPRTVERAVFRLTVTVERTLDLRDPALSEALGLTGTPGVFLDREVARATARFLRATVRVQALLVPTVAFLDDPSRWVMVLFLDMLPGEAEQYISSVEPAGTFRVGE